VTWRATILALAVAVAGCESKGPTGPGGAPPPNAAGLVPLPCGAAHLKAASPLYCLLRRNYVTPQARDVIVKAADLMAKRYPGLAVVYMDASGPDGHKPFQPHLSHGDGREIDLALVYDDLANRPLPRPPTLSGYGAYEPVRLGEHRACGGQKGPSEPDAPADRRWRLDDARTKSLVSIVTADPRVKRVFLEPHLKQRLGLATNEKIHFQGCWAGRHDDHLHVDLRDATRTP
jgi:murein endopeptidase